MKYRSKSLCGTVLELAQLPHQLSPIFNRVLEYLKSSGGSEAFQIFKYSPRWPHLCFWKRVYPNDAVYVYCLCYREAFG
ncbi:hypothetical protein LKMONMHP_1094 [Methylobacterium organophilum]|uniref:Transposase n=1 Tax=Methylobacterium organophilum TaxID=410 RepID=A0ABQ4T7R1_METOR|nr:hypothetical protein LKMONMHP_1094 [Methylobacterium organophilum]